MSPKPKSLSGDDSIAAALSLLTALSTAPGNTVSASSFCRDLGIDAQQLDVVLRLLQALADERTGARIAIGQDGDDITLLGNSGDLAPLRLTQPEALALEQALKRCKLDDATRGRIYAALGPAAGAADEGTLLAGDALLGGYYPLIAEAIAIGARLRMGYRAGSEQAPSTRIIDPGYIEVAGSAAYLIAWNINKDAQRSYRLDRISQLELTDDSVVDHPFVRRSAAESLREHGQTAIVRWASKALFDSYLWAGIDQTQARQLDGGAVEAPVTYTSPSWLFDQVLGAGGHVVIESPRDLIQDFIAYAQQGEQ